MEHGELMTECFDVGLKCAATAIMVLAGNTLEQGHDIAAAARAFWPSRSNSNRRWLAQEIVQQPVNLFLQKSANVLQMLDFIGFLRFFAF
jgi:hypothetical protein